MKSATTHYRFTAIRDGMTSTYLKLCAWRIKAASDLRWPLTSTTPLASPYVLLGGFRGGLINALDSVRWPVGEGLTMQNVFEAK